MVDNKPINIELDSSRCLDCGACNEVCPACVLHVQKGLLKEFDPNKCLNCRMCVDVCPTLALRIGFGKKEGDLYEKGTRT